MYAFLVQARRSNVSDVKLPASAPLCALLAACAAGPVEWHEPSESRRPLPQQYGGQPPAAGPELCPGSLRVIPTEGAHYAAWWSKRADGSAELMAASGNHAGWSLPVRVDTMDAGRTGCDRPPPAIWVDEPNVHIAYFMRAREGPGIFLAHSMDGGKLFHFPVAVVYGERPAPAAVSAAGNLVIVAYEDPNTTPTRISVAISTTMGHLFEFRQVLSPSGRAAADPWVFTRSDSVVVGWSAPGDTSPPIARRGRIRSPAGRNE